MRPTPWLFAAILAVSVPLGSASDIVPRLARLAQAGGWPWLAFGLAQLIVLGLLIWGSARRFTSDPLALALTWWFAFGTLLRQAAYGHSPDMIAAILTVGGYLALVHRRPAPAGGLLALSVFIRLPNALGLAIAGVYVALTMTRRDGVAFTGAAAAVLAVAGAAGALGFGAPFWAGYGGSFDRPLWPGLAAEILDARQGVLIAAPMTCLTVPGLSALWRRSRAETWLLGALIAAPLLLFAPYRAADQGGAPAVFLLTAIVLTAAPIAALAAELLSPSTT
jgi:hypothetical protein